MSQDLPSTPPTAFGLERFADLLPARDPIPGEDPGSFETFHAAMMASLVPFTPYECVIGENLVAIEWELAQHRRMRDAGLRDIIRSDLQGGRSPERRGARCRARRGLGGTCGGWRRRGGLGAHALRP